MVIDTNTIIELGKIIGALGIIGGLIIGVIKWFQKQEKQSKYQDLSWKLKYKKLNGKAENVEQS